MSRIDATIATQVGDVARPRQAAREAELQNRQAQNAIAEADAPKEPNALEQAIADSTDLRKSLNQVKQVVEAASGHRLSLDIDEKTREYVMYVRDSETGEVIRQIPAKEALELKSRIDSLIGMFVDKQA